MRFRVLLCSQPPSSLVTGSAVTLPFLVRLCGSSLAAIPCFRKKTGSSSRTLLLLLRVSRVIDPPGAIPWPDTYLGDFFPYCDIGSWSPRCDRFPGLLRSARAVSHDLDGFLLQLRCGFVSPRCHIWGSLFRGFPSHTAVRARHSPLPSCRFGLLPTVG